MEIQSLSPGEEYQILLVHYQGDHPFFLTDAGMICSRDRLVNWVKWFSFCKCRSKELCDTWNVFSG